MSITHLQSADSEGPLVATPNQAMKRLQISRSTLYALLNASDLESYTQGRSRRITIRSITSYVERRLVDDLSKLPPMIDVTPVSKSERAAS
jgi:excisionase family DNA binding protein